MSKQHNMGRGSHLSEEAERQESLVDINDEVLNDKQPTRPTVHERHISQNSKKEPPIKPNHGGKPIRVM